MRLRMSVLNRLSPEARSLHASIIHSTIAASSVMTPNTNTTG